MKRIFIGVVIMLSGLLVTLSIIIVGAVYATHINAWSGKSKLWFAIFGEKQYGDEVVDSLFLGFPFVIGVIFFLLGFIILVYEYYKTFKDQG
ncbi:hypothetical protein [Bacillus massiliigorillae]|uniref:hypothetical protein n=1 Tax=Bacillus massiliigorillae TaxID=1243664 RepID=UPI00039DAE44|nr:hypothetical protein [Bacillus massiliigorillae]